MADPAVRHLLRNPSRPIPSPRPSRATCSEKIEEVRKKEARERGVSSIRDRRFSASWRFCSGSNIRTTTAGSAAGRFSISCSGFYVPSTETRRRNRWRTGRAAGSSYKTVRAGIVVFGHGSSVASANEAVRTIAARAAREGAWDLYETAFLEAAPRPGRSGAKLAAAGAGRDTGAALLPDARHPSAARSAEAGGRTVRASAELPIRVAPPLDGHPELSRILVARARRDGAAR